MLYRLSYSSWQTERVKGIEPSSSAWKAVALPLSYTRKQTPREPRPHPADAAVIKTVPPFGTPPEQPQQARILLFPHRNDVVTHAGRQH